MSRFLIALCVVCSGCVLGDEQADANVSNTLEVQVGRIQVAPNPLAFPPTELGESSVLTFQVANTGDETLRVESVEIVEGDEDSDSEIIAGQVWTPRFDVAKGGAPKTMSLEWRPVNTKPDTAKLRFKVVNAVNATSGVYEVPVSTPRIAPSLVAPAGLSFSDVLVGETRREVIYLQNDGSAALHISALAVEPQAEFRLRFPDPEAADVEAAAESERYREVLRPGERIPVRVYFTPGDAERASASIRIASDSIKGAEHRIALSGEVSRCVHLDAAPNTDAASDATHRLELGERQIGRATTRTIRVQNCSATRALKVSGVGLVDDAGGAFELVQEQLPEALRMGGALEIEAGEAASLVVAFTPEDEQVKRGRLVLSSDARGSERLRIDLEGQGALNRCPAALAEGVVVGEMAAPATRIETQVLKTVRLSGTSSYDPDGTIDAYEWNLISKPNGSSARLVTSNRVAEPSLFLDIAGSYEIELVVIDKLGTQSCEVARVTIIAS